jgi:hypothetical protein
MIIATERWRFEVVNKIPTGYEIWNIGKNMVDGYIPLAEVDGYEVNPETLKAIRIEDAQELDLLRNCASYGVNNLDRCRKALKYQRRGYIKKRQRALAEQSIKYFEELTEE